MHCDKPFPTRQHDSVLNHVDYVFVATLDIPGLGSRVFDDSSPVPMSCILTYNYPRCAWAATGIVVRWFVCLFVTSISTHLDAIALRLQHR